MENFKRMPESLQSDVWKKLFSVCDIHNMTKQEYENYQYSLKAYRDIRSNEIYWEEKMAAQEAKGKAKGLAEGEAKEKYNSVRNMKEIGLSLEQIMQVSGLSAEEIEKIL